MYQSRGHSIVVMRYLAKVDIASSSLADRLNFNCRKEVFVSAATLVLNMDGTPLDIQKYTKAVKKVHKKIAILLEEYEDKRLQSWNDGMNAPAVIKMLHFVRPHTPKSSGARIVPFTRRNVWARDRGLCQYCGKFVTFDNLHWDHVLPKSRGGKSTWYNVCCCCLECNNKKDCKTPEEAGLLRPKLYAPRQQLSPQQFMIMKLKSLGSFPHEKWKDYIYWNIELDQ